MNADEQERLVADARIAIAAIERYDETNKFRIMYPATGKYRRELYVPHNRFFELGRTYRERAFIGGNRTGKTWGVGAYEVACHLTGAYPDWWDGRRFNGPTRWFACGDTIGDTRDIVQTKLLGPIHEDKNLLGTGMIPATYLDQKKIRPRQNGNGALDWAMVRHVTGGWSRVQFKSYEQGRETFQGTEQDGIWIDEEPKEDVYGECLMRTATTDGIIILTFTPLRGVSNVVKSFLDFEKANKEGASKIFVQCSMDDVPHMTPKMVDEALAGTPIHQREARRKGNPVSSIGRIYPVDEASFVIAPFKIPDFWPRAFGFDGGYYNTAAVWGAYDRENKRWVLYSEHKPGEAQIAIHASAIKARGAWIPGVGDAAATSQHDGQKTLRLYQAEGVDLRLADKAVDAGIGDVLEHLTSGRLQVFMTLGKWLDEFRLYRTDENQNIVKENDHLMDATRYLIRSGLRVATTQQRKHVRLATVNFG